MVRLAAAACQLILRLVSLLPLGTRYNPLTTKHKAVDLSRRSSHLNPGRYKQNKLRQTLTRMAQLNKKTLPEGVSPLAAASSLSSACLSNSCSVQSVFLALR